MSRKFVRIAYEPTGATFLGYRWRACVDLESEALGALRSQKGQES